MWAGAFGGGKAKSKAACSSLHPKPSLLPQDLINSFLKHFSGVAAYLDATRAAARRDGGVATLAGRRRPIKGLGATDKRWVWVAA